MTSVFDWEPELVVKWLESPEGEDWSRLAHKPVPMIIIGVKDDLDGARFDSFVTR